MTLEPYQLEQHLKGNLGELFTLYALYDFVLERNTELVFKSGIHLRDKEGVYGNDNLYEVIADGYPDFKIQNTGYYIEVKTIKRTPKRPYGKLNHNQRPVFKELLSKGNKIFLIIPTIIWKRMQIKCKKFDCYEIILNTITNRLNYKKLEFDELKEVLT